MVDTQFSPETGRGRDPVRIAALLVELGRVMKAQLFYPSGHRNLRDLFGRVFGDWQEELHNNGALELEVHSRYFVLTEARSPIDPGELGPLAHEFELRGVHRIRLEPDTDAEAFQAFVVAMTTGPERLAESGGVERALANCRGVAVNGLGSALRREDETTASREPIDDAIPVEALMVEGSVVSEEDIDPRRLEQNPLGVPTTNARTGHLLEQLRELDECHVDATYDPLIERIVAESVGLFHEGLMSECYRSILVISEHCMDDAKRNPRQQVLAREALAKLVQGPILEDVMNRACAPGAEASIRAAQVVVQLGEGAVRPLFDALISERDPERRGQLNGVLIAVGASAVLPLHQIIDSGDLSRMRLAVRLCGEIQNPEAVERLAELLASQEVSLRKEAAKALARIGSPAAVKALISALDSPVPEVPALAAYCLGATRSAAAVGPLLHTLESCLDHGPVELSRETIRALGRLGREEAADALAGIVTRKSLLHRKRHVELKLTATTALGHIPGETALQALTRVARSTDARLRRAAQEALDRRAS